ncbi:TRAPP subunit bet5 [Tulasnella sp. 424]|nr:TRAPP subunit bet5 [Tulasnella sp. 424]
MTVYSLYIYDRHCQCVFYHDWQRVKKARPANEGIMLSHVSASTDITSPRNTLSVSSGIVIASTDSAPPTPAIAPPVSSANLTSLPFDEEAKLVYGVILSLRNMAKKLSGRDETFVNYRTSTYKLHHYETISGYKFVMFTDPNTAADTIRFVLRQIYTSPFIEFVVRNPLIDMDSKDSGIDNDHFRTAVDKMIRNLAIYA